ncbi:AAR152Wp [Eremothecium gossypii ATCC 10895]|uniref:precorrin-2 dehydrogenase n=1 Tax=Eremothecium gossypii (strain ATCC 10895 / CBS 109.51 / FGSC 9923 / NRRL Y-1056) TaxID=284811 RepID=Q75EC2_EREGS|nr:AAR152Wp [Eremothecium gossypii ATCC 10895]AAS50519.1 AAR152Wp [Eremothecium gossypii ATCC 10895]
MLSLPLAHQMGGRHVLLVGCGAVGMTRVDKLVPTGCKLTVVAPEVDAGLAAYMPGGMEVAAGATWVNKGWEPGQVYRVARREFAAGDEGLEAFAFVLACVPAGGLGARVHALSHARGVQCNVADVPALCDFYFGSQCALGERGLQVLVSSNGAAPRLTALLRADIERRYAALDWDEMCGRLRALRERARALSTQAGLPAEEALRFRMDWMRQVTDAFGLEHCAAMDVERLAGLFGEMAAAAAAGRPRALPADLVSVYTESST